MSKNRVTEPATARDLSQALLSGVPPEKLRPALARLSPADLQKVLCTVCSACTEANAISLECGEKIQTFLKDHCQIYSVEHALCRIGFFFRLHRGA